MLKKNGGKKKFEIVALEIKMPIIMSIFSKNYAKYG